MRRTLSLISLLALIAVAIGCSRAESDQSIRAAATLPPPSMGSAFAPLPTTATQAAIDRTAQSGQLVSSRPAAPPAAAPAPAPVAQAGPSCSDLTYDSQGAAVRATYCLPGGDARDLPAVVILPGCGGPPEFSEVGPALAGEGFATLYIDYFTQAGPPGGPMCQAGGPAQRAAFRTWLQSIGDGVTWLSGQPRVSPDRIGIFGYSLGAAVAMHAASWDPRYKAVVFLSGLLIEFLPPRPAALPPIAIFHGDADDAVPVAQAYQLRDMVAAEGRPHEFVVYPGNGHGWPGANWLDVYRRTVAFFRANLGG